MVRGAAIVLMVLDHVLIQVDADSTVRGGAPWSVTRASLPLFMLVSAAVWRRSGRVRWRLLAVAGVEAFLYGALDMPLPGIVVLIFVVVTGLDSALSADLHPVGWYALAVLGGVQALYVRVGWAGYEPGLLLLWFSLGRLVVPSIGYDIARIPPRPARLLMWIGRWPLSWYVGHLVVIWAGVNLLA